MNFLDEGASRFWEYIFGEIDAENHRLEEFLKPENSAAMKEGNFLMILRRWNSYTPAMVERPEVSRGGGYFLVWNGKGLVIDPGFNFLHNFRERGFLLHDIDAILITHAHIDHCVDLESLMTLLYEYNERRCKNGEPTKTFQLFMNSTAMKKCAGWLSLLPTLYENVPAGSNAKEIELARVHPMEPGDTKLFPCNGSPVLKFKITRCKHKEVTGSGYATGLIVELIEGGNVVSTVIFTGDTGWEDNIQQQYVNGCDLLVAHLGGIQSQEIFGQPYKYHLGFIGIVRMIQNITPKMVVISEFGEELATTRSRIVDMIRRSVRHNRCFNGDIGTKVSLPEPELMCWNQGCLRLAEPEEVREPGGIVKYLCLQHRLS
ncbi:MBL fold metallo-hydrolase [Candidatus Poribacteria bacterium]|nr:MBL fold metallo-hydrolase [Candidatus Poribacteria bacterium]